VDIVGAWKKAPLRDSEGFEEHGHHTQSVSIHRLSAFANEFGLFRFVAESLFLLVVDFSKEETLCFEGEGLGVGSEFEGSMPRHWLIGNGRRGQGKEGYIQRRVLAVELTLH